MKYVYKIVAALGALSVIPLVVFLKTIYFKVSSTALNAIFTLGQLFGIETLDEAVKNNNGVAPKNIADSFSLYDLYNIFDGFSGKSSDGEFVEKLEAMITPAITSGVIVIMLVLCAVITAVFALVMKNNRYVIYSSIAGIGLSFMLKESFEAVAAPVLDGTISITTLTENFLGGLIGNFEELFLNTNFWFIPVVFGAVILWTVLYNYTLPDKEKKERKLMLGELDD